MAEIDGTELPVRLHDLLLAMAGRIDDDALSEIRELTAVAELDRAVDLLVGTLVAGRVPVTARERVEISRMLDEVRSDPRLADDLVVADSVPVVRHRFSGGSEPGGGLAETLRGVLDVLPDVLAVGSTWRVTPAGAAPGPLPQRVVLVEVGPDGHPPATAYRVEHVLRRAGVRAVVEVLRPGVERTEYHQQAAAAAQPVAFTGGQNGSRPFESATRHASRHHRAEPDDSERVPDRASAPDVEVDAATSTRMLRAVPVLPDRIEVRGQAGEPLAESISDDPAGHRPEDHTRVAEPIGASADDAISAEAELAEPAIDPVPAGDEPSDVDFRDEPAPVPSLPPSVDGRLNDKERELLRQLHEELAQREQQRARRSAGGAASSNRWQVDRSGERGGFSQTVHGLGGRSGPELVNGHRPPPYPPAG
ncbi:hypothetical protein [Gandjariella thermophila]|uniref:Uncharacterized protein n=1 Tax=Gandjariella thermophila TaxID=1931992 RepID=A0A4D4J265_9PSEU|nr:hypothetical protein [Gandjariella thermophila]GDY30715.1 hypothetical protein GTS_23480 [Gandjariella thermophila]